MKVLFLTAYPNLAASSRTRVYQFLPLLKKENINYKVICFVPSQMYRYNLALSSDKILPKLVYYNFIYIIRLLKTFQSVLIARNYDIIFIQKVILPVRLEKILKILNKNMIFEFDDAIFASGKDEKGFIGKMKRKFQNAGFERMLKFSRCCLVENEYNRNIALKYCPDVMKITGPIDTKRYFVKREKKREEKKVVIGWIGSPYTTEYLYRIKDALEELSAKYNFVLRLVGAKRDFKIERVNYEIKDWSLTREVSDLNAFDIGIMPLSDDEWTKGKGGYKLLQYMSMGVPGVASPVEINKEIIEDGVNGFLADTHEEWVKKLSILIENKTLRKEMGKIARITVEKRYALDNAAKKLIKMFERVAREGEN